VRWRPSRTAVLVNVTKLLPHFAMSDCCDQAAAGERMRIDVSLGRLQDCLCFDGLACSCRCRDTL